MSTYTIYLAGAFYAIGSDLLMETLTSLETGRTRSGIRTVSDRNQAILDLASPLPWRAAYDLARRSGEYIGQLFTEDAHVIPVLPVDHREEAAANAS